MGRNDGAHVLDISVTSRLSRYRKCQQNTVLMELLGFHVNAMELPYQKSQSHYGQFMWKIYHSILFLLFPLHQAAINSLTAF